MTVKMNRSRAKRLVSLTTLITVLILSWVTLQSSRTWGEFLRVGLLDEPKTLNPFAASDIWAAKVLLFCYQNLYYRDPQSDELVPWLAASPPVWNPSTKTVTFQLREAFWDDGSPLTSEDVVFTAKLIQRFRIPRYWNNWEFVKEVEGLGPHTVRLTLKEPKALLWDRTLTSFVVQKSRWERIQKEAEDLLQRGLLELNAEGIVGKEALNAALVEPLQLLTSRPLQRPESSGPFVFQRWQRGSFVYLRRNPRFFSLNRSISGYPVGPHVDGLLFKIYANMDTAILALKKGDIDYLWWSIEAGYLEDLQQNPNVRIDETLKTGYRYLGFNLRRPPMDDRSFRMAVAHLVDKDFIVQRILHDQGVRLDTLVPPEPPFYHDSHTPVYGKDLSWKERVQKARRILYEAGYRWEVEPQGGGFAGRFETRGKELRLPSGEPVPTLDLFTPPADYDTQRAQTGSVIQKWLLDFGIPIYWRPMSFGAMIKRVKADHDFDMFISGWSVGRDPDYLRSFFHSRSDRPNGQNSMGYRHAEFDRLADRQARTMDTEERRDLVFRLQEILMRDLPCLPLYVPKNLEGTRVDHFRGWVQMTGGIGNLWSFLRVEPVNRGE